MTIARKRIVAAQITPDYHVMGRCVRRAFLCGFDQLSNRDYSHRRQWVVDRLGELAEIFAIDILAYAIMSNHYHLVIRLRSEQTQAWSDPEVIERWAQLFGLPPLLQKLQAGACSAAEYQAASCLLEQRRQRLGDLSWFMKCLNEHIARKANKEDHCTGAFWEGRFKSQALLDEKALLSCMAYVDLNPIRAKLAQTPESSDYTSIQARINHKLQKPIRLALFVDQAHADQKDTAISFYYKDYLTLVDWTGRAQRHDKRGHIANELPDILSRLGFDQSRWFKSMKLYHGQYQVIGEPERIRILAKSLSRKWFLGMSEMRAFSKS